MEKEINEMEKYLNWICGNGFSQHQITWLLTNSEAVPVAWNLSTDNIKKLDADNVKGTYISLNPVTNENINKQKKIADVDVLCRVNMLFDVDAEKPEEYKKYAATETEHNETIKKTYIIKNWCNDKGFPQPLILDTGNGCALIFALDMWENNEENKQLIKNLFNYIEKETNIHLDRTVINAGRITRIPGTNNRKLENNERKNRQCKLLECPERKTLSIDKVIELIGKPEIKIFNTNENIDVSGGINQSLEVFEKWLRKQLSLLNINIKSIQQSGNLFKFHLDKCPISKAESESYNDYSAFYDVETKKIGYHNFHDHGVDLKWKDFRKAIEPDWQEFDSSAEYFGFNKEEKPIEVVQTKSDEDKHEYEKYYDGDNKAEKITCEFNQNFLDVAEYIKKIGGRSNQGIQMGLAALSSICGARVVFDVNKAIYRTDLRLIDIASTGSNKTKSLEKIIHNLEFYTKCWNLGTSTLQGFIADQGFKVYQPKQKFTSFEEQIAEKNERDINIKKVKENAKNQKFGTVFYADDALSWLSKLTDTNAKQYANNDNLAFFCKIMEDCEPGSYITKGNGEIFYPDSPRNFFLNVAETYFDWSLNESVQNSGALFRMLPCDSDTIEFNYNGDAENGKNILLNAVNFIKNNKIILEVTGLDYNNNEVILQRKAVNNNQTIIKFWDNNPDIIKRLIPKAAIQAKKIAAIMTVCDWAANPENNKKYDADTIREKIDGSKYYEKAFSYAMFCHVTSIQKAYDSTNVDNDDLLKLYNLAKRYLTEFNKHKNLQNIKKLYPSNLARNLRLKGKGYQSSFKRMNELAEQLILTGDAVWVEESYKGIEFYGRILIVK